MRVGSSSNSALMPGREAIEMYLVGGGWEGVGGGWWWEVVGGGRWLVVVVGGGWWWEVVEGKEKAVDTE